MTNLEKQFVLKYPEFKKFFNVSTRYSFFEKRARWDMIKKLTKEGFPNLNVMVVDKWFAEEAIENGKDVFAIKSGSIVLLNKVNEVSQYKKNGYLMALTPSAYKDECNRMHDDFFNQEDFPDFELDEVKIDIE